MTYGAYHEVGEDTDRMTIHWAGACRWPDCSGCHGGTLLQECPVCKCKSKFVGTGVCGRCGARLYVASCNGKPSIIRFETPSAIALLMKSADEDEI